MTTRQDAVNEALTWLGTPYHHHGRVKGVGVDCGQILIAVYSAVGKTQARTIEYAHDWHLHHGEEQFLAFLDSFGAHEITTAPQPGDIAVYKFGRCFSHGAIVIDARTVVHSYIGLGVVVNNTDDYPLDSREVRYWAFDWKE
jgi:cell wall-associated NlpC family hydrolase